MLAGFFLVVGICCVFCCGVVAGHGWRRWGDDVELAPGVTGLAALYLLAAIAAFVARSLA